MYLNVLIIFVMHQARMREANRNSNVQGNYVRDVVFVQKKSIMYYQQTDLHPFIKITVALPTMVASCRGKLRYYSRHSMSNILLILLKLIEIQYCLIDI